MIGLQGIGCDGELELAEDEDFDKWAILIKVKFRDNEQLQLLTAHRQSGGVCGVFWSFIGVRID